MTKIKVGCYEFNPLKGHRYLAGRPFATGMYNEGFDVAIVDISPGFSFNATPVRRVPDLSYAAANDLLDAFNNGESSFEGRLIG